MSEAQELISVKVDGKEVQVPKGTLAIRAAEMVGVHIPRFCDHPLLKPVAACRACLVEVAAPGRDGTVAKMPKPQPACSTAVTPGMEIYTQFSSEVSAKAQEGILEFLLVNHPLDCPVCDKGGECPLQNQAYADGRGASRFTDVKRTFPKPIRLTSEVLLDRDRCVLCQRCIRFGKEIAGDAFLDLQGRGGGTCSADHHQHMGAQIGTFDSQVLGYVDEEANPSGHELTPAESLAGPTGEAGVIGTMNSGHVNIEDQDVSERRFSSYFSGNVIQICPVGALTSATYRFRARPFDLISTPSITDQDASGAAIRVDARRGVVTRQLAGDDPEVNEEWISDKDRFAFPWQSSADRLTRPLVRDENGQLVPTSWSDALERAAAAVKSAREGKGMGFLPGGRLTLEDYYAWSKFARLVAHSHHIDGRARNISGEENRFIRSTVAGTGLGVTYADVEKAPQVVLIALEPEDECATLFLRLRKAALQGSKILSISSWETPGSKKMNAQVIKAVPGTEAEIVRSLNDEVRQALGQGGVVMLGERAATVPGLIDAARELATSTGARLAWVPRRAGERAAIEAGCFPGLLPGGRLVDDPEARADLAAVWGVKELPGGEHKCGKSILKWTADGDLEALMIGGVDLRDLPDPELARAALAKAKCVIQLEVRRSAITEDADIVLPVAPPHEKTGTFINWEGRLRPFGQALASHALADWQVLSKLAAVAGVDLGLNSVKQILAEYEELATWDGKREDVSCDYGQVDHQVGEDQVLLSTWKPLLDAGRCQDGEPHLAGTARKPVARTSAATAEKFGVAGEVKVVGARGAITLPLVITDMPDGVVWVPQCSPGSTVHETLGVRDGEAVSLKTVEVIR